MIATCDYSSDSIYSSQSVSDNSTGSSVSWSYSNGVITLNTSSGRYNKGKYVVAYIK